MKKVRFNFTLVGTWRGEARHDTANADVDLDVVVLSFFLSIFLSFLSLLC